ncbi:MAG: hypothetical protein E7312_02955, partial [Clostridiales bacterium]|nr:hypothetical protein [Clostridiales bacterium]
MDVGDTDPDTYVVSFDANGGTSSMANVNAFGEYTLPENGFTAPDGKRFKCWNVNGVEKSAGDTITVLANVSIKAVWEDAPIPEIWVGGVGMFDGDYLANDAMSTTRTQPISGGYAHYSEGILTLYGYSYTGKGYYNESEYNYAAIYSTIDIAIVCVEDTFSSLVAQGDDSCNGIVSTSDVLIRGNGSLTVKAEDRAIFIDGDLTVNGIGLTVINVWSNQANSISITTGKGVEVTSTKGIGFMAQDDVNIYASKLKITAFDHAIHTSGNVNLSGEILELDSTNGSGIYAMSGDTVVNNKNVTISGYASISCDELTINSSNVELNGTLNYHHAILAYNNVIIIAENITIKSNGNGIFSYGDIVVKCDNIEIDCVYGTALYASDKLVDVEAEYIDLSAQTCIMANEVLVTATNDIDLCATSSYGIYSESDVRITTKNINIESHDTAFYSDNGRLIINATENVSLISNGGKQAVYGYLTVTAKEFIMAGVTLNKLFEYTFNNQFDKEYAVFEGDAVDNLTQTHVISSNSSYIDRIETNVVKITELVHILSDWKHNDTHHWRDCSCGSTHEMDTHRGGTATCNDRAICVYCSEPYGDLADHDYGELIPAVDEKHTPAELSPSVAAHYHCAECGKYFTEGKTETTLDSLTGETPTHSFDQKHNSTHHWDECSCGLKQNESIHTGGTATCKDRAICQTCFEPYGDLADHDYGELIPASAEKHTPAELSPSVAAHYHCAECGKYFTESKAETTLDALTGETPSHSFDQKHNSTHHWDECSCGLKQNKSIHTGGTATCKEKAICETCSAPYGDLSDHDYGELIPESAEKHTPTELKPSVAAHYHCAECGKYFTQSKTETTLAELTGETPTHSFDQKHNSTHHWDECSCGLKQNENLHTGGTATCKERAICETCSEPYGDLADHDYGELIPAVDEKHTQAELSPSV